MMYNKNNLAIHRIASSDESRPILTGVRFESNATVATDGYKLMIVQTAPDSADQVVDGLDGIRVKEGHDNVIIDRQTVAKIERELPKKPLFEWLKGTFFTATSDDKVAELMTTDGVNHTKHIAKPIEGDYPDYNAIMPKGKPAIKVGFNAKMMKAIIDTFLAMSLPDSANTITLSLYANDEGIDDQYSLKPISMTAKTNEGQNVQAVLMPVRVTNNDSKAEE